MTCIVAMVRNGKVYMGADSAGVADYTIRQRKDSKLFANGELLFGFTSSFRFGQILQYHLAPPKHHGEMSAERYMVTCLIPAVREELKSHGYTKIESNNEKGGQCLIGYRGRLFFMDPDFQVGETYDGFDAVGIGHDLAMGSLNSSIEIRPKAHPTFHLELALRAAAKYSAGVAGPFRFLSTGVLR